MRSIRQRRTESFSSTLLGKNIHPSKIVVVINWIFIDRCGHCKEFDPIYKKVAKKMLKNNENIVFGKMDGTANDIPYMFPPIKVSQPHQISKNKKLISKSIS